MLVYVLITCIAVSATNGKYLGELPTDRPLVIAHRGSSGELPEHTVEAYQLAIDQGADVIECDLAVTKDRMLICSHEGILSPTTDVATKFPEKRATYYVEEVKLNITDYFTIDLTLEEIKTLRKVQDKSYRDQSYNGMFAIATLEENIQVAQAAQGRTVGIYPETKFPKFFNDYLRQFNTTMEEILVNIIKSYGYDSFRSPCFLQSFYPQSVKDMAKLTDVRIVYLTVSELSDEMLIRMTPYATGIGPRKDAIVEIDENTNKIVRTTDFMSRLKKYGYTVHAWTFRNENQFLAFDYAGDPYNEYKHFLDLGLDGLFTDFPATMVNYLSMRSC